MPLYNLDSPPGKLAQSVVFARLSYMFPGPLFAERRRRDAAVVAVETRTTLLFIQGGKQN